MGIRTLVAAAVCAATALSGGMAAAAPASTTAGPAAATAREDFNGDGYQDLAVSAPAATINGHSWAGYIVISYGSAQGLGTAHTTIITQDTPGVPGTSGDDHGFGYRMFARDLDGDGLTDLALVTNEALAATNNSGSVIVLWGRSGGVTGQGSVRIPAPADATVGGNLTMPATSTATARRT